MLAALVALAVGSVAQIGPTSGAYRRSVDRSYAALLAPVAASTAISGALARRLLAGAPAMQRPALFAALDRLAADTAAERRRLGTATPPAPATAAAVRCADALAGRAAGAARLRGALEGALGGPTGLAPAAQGAPAGVTAAVVDWQDADTAWAACRRGLRRAPGSASLAASVWLPGGGLSARGVVGLVAATTASTTLAAVHKLAIVALVTDPPAVVSGQTLVVVPAPAVVVGVVVADEGNVEERGVEVGGVLQLTGAPASPPTVQRTLDLDAGASSTLTLPGFKVQPGSSYTLEVTAQSPPEQGAASLVTRTVPLQVQQAATATVVTAPLRTGPGRPVTFTATVTTPLRGVSVPGTVAFFEDGSVLASCAARPLHHDQATCTTTEGSVAVHAVGAQYAGTARFAPSASPDITVQVVRG